MYNTSDLKRGLIIDFEDAPYIVESYQSSDPRARGATVIHKVRLRNLKTKQKLDKSFRSGDTFGVPDFSRQKVQFLYADSDAFHFMDLTSYEQFFLPAGDLEWESKFLVEEMEVLALIYKESPIALELPPTVALTITQTNPAVKGNSATSRTKPATLETGHSVQVPEHISEGERLNIDTRTGDFLGRATK
ncbi:MAG: elongation factor P [Planctomycetota bacterium]